MGCQLYGTHGHSHGGASAGHGHSENMNVRAAFIHVLGDVLQSIGVFCAAIVIYFKPEWKLADPICTFIFSIIVLYTTITILKDAILVSINILKHIICKCTFNIAALITQQHTVFIFNHRVFCWIRVYKADVNLFIFFLSRSP